MRARREFLVAAPLVVAAALFGLISRDVLFGSSLAVLPLLSPLTRRRLFLGPQVQIILGLFGVILCSGFVVALPQNPVLAGETVGSLAFCIGVSSLVLASFHAALARPLGGAPVTVALGMVSLLASGSTYSGVLFPVGLTLYLLLGSWAVHRADPDRPAWGALDGRHWGGTVGILAIAAAISIGFAWVLPPLYVQVSRWIPGWARHQSGFADGPIRLGSLRRMILSDAVVLRVHGELSSSYLRGKVLRQYTKGEWRSREKIRGSRDYDEDLFPPYTEIELVKNGLRRFFLPMDVARLQLDPSDVAIQETGVLRPLSGDVVRYRYREGRPTEFPIAPPDPVDDLEVPADAPGLRATLDGLLGQWASAAETDVERLQAIEEGLSREFTYSLNYRRPPKSEKMVEFLERDRRGHCEYFASAMALMARRAGIPARVVAGYHVNEWNALGGYHIVRQRDAHAWVEAWVNTGAGARWQIYDPSPAPQFETGFAIETPLISAVWDLLRLSASRVGLWPILSALVIVLGVLVLRRRLRGRVGPPGTSARGYSGPPEYLQSFFDGLAEHGCPHESSVGLDGYADQVELRAGEVAATLLRRYASWRYGDLDDDGSIRQAMEQWSSSERVRASEPR